MHALAEARAHISTRLHTCVEFDRHGHSWRFVLQPLGHCTIAPRMQHLSVGVAWPAAAHANTWPNSGYVPATRSTTGSHYPNRAQSNLLPRGVRCSQQCAMPVQRARVLEQARRMTSPQKNKCDKQVSSWRHISCHTDKNRYCT